MIGYVETFNVEYYSELVDATVETNEANQIQNYFPPIAWLFIIGQDQGIVEGVKYSFSAPTNTEN